jgi:hypothetical protein
MHLIYMVRVLIPFLLACCLASMQPAHFTFAGLDLSLTAKDLKAKYPRSHFVDETLMQLRENESHDHISTIALSGSGGAKTLRIFFERTHPAGKPIYPRCDDVLGVLQKRYGRPANIVDAAEEQALNRRFEWNRSVERLTLICFRMPRQPLFASELTIASRN